MRPHPMLDMADAVHVEGVEADLFRHRAAFWPWAGGRVFANVAAWISAGTSRPSCRPGEGRRTIRMALRQRRRPGQMTAGGRLFVRSVCRKPLLVDAGSKSKTLVSPGRDLVAFLLVGADAADIRHEYARLPRDVGADIPRVRQRMERTIRDL